MKNRKAKKGFTIIELVIVIAVIGILAAVLIPTFSNVIDKANATAAMENARNAYTQYMIDAAQTGTVEEDMCIKSGKYYFHVVDGQFNATAATDANNPAFGTNVTPTLYDVVDGKLVKNTTEGATHTHTAN